LIIDGVNISYFTLVKTGLSRKIETIHTAKLKLRLDSANF
jgi:hypothetical protein